jgi:hypothetical protein
MNSSHVLQSLRRHMNWLQPQVHDEIVAALKKEGLIKDDSDAINARADRSGLTPLTPMQAAAQSPEKHRVLQQTLGMIRHLSAGKFDLPLDRPVNIAEVNAAIRNADPERRIAVKSNLAQLGLIR